MVAIKPYIKAIILMTVVLIIPALLMKIIPHTIASNLPSKNSTKPLIVLCMRAYVPTMTAGAEITSHITNKYIQAAGWDVVVIVKHWSVPQYEDIPILPSYSSDPAIYDNNPLAASYLSRASIIGFQNIDFEDALGIAKYYKKPAVFFIHATSAGKEFFNYTSGWPIGIVYNSWTMMGDISAPYKSYIVKPWVDMNRFRFIPSNPKYITLINLNESKGGDFLITLARKMPDVKFLAVEGGYGKQIKDERVQNIKYISKTDRIEDVYNQTKVLLVPSKQETWGRVAVEAMTAGIPVIVNDIPGLRECVGEAGLICRREDLTSWEQQIRKLLKIPSYYQEWSQRSLRRSIELKDDKDMRGIGQWLHHLALQP
jgi:glycosyltransferase involved in cell wall biosynthesis